MQKLIAIIDDDQAIRDGLSSLLRSFGFQVLLYGSGEDFLNDEERNCPDIVLTDIQMPGMSGLDLQRIMNEQEPKIPLLIMTAFPEDALRQRVIANGAVCFLSKPFKAAELLHWIQHALAQPKG
jgi:FixJ family two-component response regulator